MASLLKSVFGAGTTTQEEKVDKNDKDDTDSNANPDDKDDTNPSNQPEPKQLSKEELAAKRLASLESSYDFYPFLIIQLYILGIITNHQQKKQI